GRLDLLADEAVGELSGGEADSPGLKIERMTWMPAKDQPRGYVISGPVTHRGWREWSVTFVPKNSGSVMLSLLGPWEQSTPDVIFKQELLWDGLEVEGAKLTNGGFEEVRDNSPVGWQNGGGTVIESSTEAPAKAGQRLARTWHDGRLSTSLKVTSGQPVRVRAFVKAVTPAGFVEMKRIESRDTPAHRAAKRFRKGANFGNYLEAPLGQDWGAKYSVADFDHVKAEGFDHVRLPIAWHHYGSGSMLRLDKAIFEKVDPLVAEAVRLKLGIILNIHHFDRYTSNPVDEHENFFKLWKQISEHYADQPDLVAFELLNEPKDAATTEVLNPVYAEAIKLIRKTNPNRTIFVGPGKYNSVSELPNLRLPDDDRNLIVTVHCYDPFYFTHQGATFAGPDVKVTGIRFPGPPTKPLEIDPALKVNPWVAEWIKRYNTLPASKNPSSSAAFRSTVTDAAEWSAYYGRPIHFGEFGCFQTADAESRAAYYREFRSAFDEADLGWAVWDWKAGFKYWDDKAGRPAPGMREALFPKK
ncbi:MAG: glycoside hydrolase family 5 protein, partial [Planctomycetaceae bacterium]|nr:glycoside hydrolase family 5 protein [Planctomycetaceae bacterium]